MVPKIETTTTFSDKHEIPGTDSMLGEIRAHISTVTGDLFLAQAGVIIIPREHARAVVDMLYGLITAYEEHEE